MTNEVNNGDVPNGLYKSETEFDNDHQKVKITINLHFQNKKIQGRYIF